MANTLGFDIGSEYTKLYVQGEKDIRIIPSIITVENKNGSLRASGNEAKKMLGRTPSVLSVKKPITDGFIGDIDLASAFLSDTLEKLELGSLFKRTSIIATLPCGTTKKEENAMEKAIIGAGIATIDYVDAPIAIALGAGMPTNISTGRMIVDVGAGHISVSIISHGDVVVSSSVKSAGNAMTDAVRQYVADAYGIEIGELTAEILKIKLATLNQSAPKKSIKIMGKVKVDKTNSDKLTSSAVISSTELTQLFTPFAEKVIERITATLEETPTEISSDISDFGILLSGGVANLTGLSSYIEKKLGVKVTTTKAPSLDAAKGIMRIIGGGYSYRRYLK